MKLRNGGSSAILVLVLIAAAVVGVFYLSRNRISNSPQSLSSTSPYVPPSPTQQPFENWKIYKNESFGVSFKYPAIFAGTHSNIFNVEIKEKIDSKEASEISVFVPDQRGYSLFDISKFINTSIEAQFKKDNLKPSSSGLVLNSTTINGKKAGEVIVNGQGVGRFIYVQSDKNVYRIMINESAAIKPTASQILQTLKFVD